MVWDWFVSTKFGRWVIGIAALVAAFIAAWWMAHMQGASAQAVKDAKAQQDAQADTAGQVKAAAQTRADVEADAAKLPDAPAQKVADADPATAAGQLRQDGWTRD